MQKTLLLLAAVVIAGGAFFWWQNRQSKPAAAPEPSRGIVTATITYTDEGYTPSTVTIQKGEAVRFVNKSEKETWPASAVHPTHSIYPQKSDSDCLGSSFDACRDLSPGESWEFTFNYEGEWRYHDHLHAYHNGTVIVAN